MTIPPPESLAVNRDDEGQIVGAQRFDASGTVAELVIERGASPDRATATATFSSSGQLVGRMTSEISVEEEYISLEVTDADASVLWWRMDFSGYDDTHLARVQLAVTGLGESVGVYSPLLRRGTLQLSPDPWLSDEQRQLLEGFRPVFEELLERFERDLEPDRELIEATMAQSVWKALGRVACRALASMAGVAIGGAVGGPIGAVVGAGVGSIASDGCSQIL